MAAALHPIRNDSGPNSLYPRALMTDFDFGDNRYPTLAPQSRSMHQSNPSTSDRSWEPPSYTDNLTSSPSMGSPRLSPSWSPAAAGDQRSQPETPYSRRPSSKQGSGISDPQGLSEQSQEAPRSSLSYALPPGAARRVVERYSLDDNGQTPSRASNETKPTLVDNQSLQETVAGRRSRPTTPQVARGVSQGRASPNRSSSRPSIPPNGSPMPSPTAAPQFPPIMPLSASPTYSPPVAPNLRAYAQQPTYVNQSNAPNPIQTVYTPIVPQQEEVCVECAMRDQDMADVDVTSPGVWERVSDVAFEDLRRREEEEEANGIVVDDPSRPRIKGGRLTEQNLKLWLSVNPREPASRQQTLNTYIKSQRTLLEAEALAHARAMQEAKQLDNRMRDAYSQLRRSAYDTGNSSSPADDTGGVRIRPPSTPASPAINQSHARSASREITLLENGMIVEHVDVRREEREARERRKREERRARKSSRSSVLDVTSVISAQSNGQLVETNLRPYSRYSQTSHARPMSVLTAPLDRPDLPRAYSQASFSDVHSLGSASPRRTRFFGMKNLSAGWRSQDSLAPSGMSGSMVDMHVALQRETYGIQQHTASPIDLNTPRRSQIWPPTGLEDPNLSQIVYQDEKVKKKKGGLAKIWRIVTGKTDGHQKSTAARTEGHEDDLPLAPPPPLSYLVDRKPGDYPSGRHASTPSLPSVTSGKFTPGMSPPTAPSSILPSPASLRPSGDIEIADARSSGNLDGIAYDDQERNEDTVRAQQGYWKSMQSVTSEAEPRSLSIPSLPSSPFPIMTSNSNGNSINSTARPSSMAREKSLPPLPVGEAPAHVLPSDRPRTFYGTDSRALPPGAGQDFSPPQAPFRSDSARRQSFGGISSRPNLGAMTMPTTKPVDFDSRRPFGPQYDDFGISRRSLGRIDNIQQRQSRAISPHSSKRKSRFGLSSLLGRKSDKREQLDMSQENGIQHFPTMGYSPYDMQDDATTNYGTSTSRHSAFSSGAPNPNLRMSVTSRKALEDLVQQDPDFVAYRYPSNDQRLDLLR